MKKLILLILFISIYLFSNGQNKYFGVFLGTSYYNGDLNKFVPFNPPSFAFGLMYAHDLSNSNTLKFYANRGNLKGNSDSLNTNFSTNIYDFGFINELYFLNFFSPPNKQRLVSPFVEYGVSILYVPQLDRTVNLSIPFGAGIRFNLFKNSIIILDWNYHITNTDKLDLINSEQTNKLSMIHNDWYSYLGITYRFRFNSKGGICPAYQ